MQTFLPYRSFVQSSKVLDRQRLGKQRIEAWQILQVLLTENKRGWDNHPAVLQWAGYEDALRCYGLSMSIEWRKRGYEDNMEKRFRANLPTDQLFNLPPWLGDERVHSSHRANLLRKMPGFYSQYNWVEKPSDEYFWPVTKSGLEKVPNGPLVNV